ncbi:MAG: TetR/AcrR family transcriptional regulator [Spirochaetaceae bacterium]|nr:TetR/AcrR family transcriptional regulator [Spirochaetaceae bacterium]
MPKIVDHDARRRLIVETALCLFAKRGFHSVSLDDIASAAGLSRTGLYRYFRNKDQIFWQAVDHALGDIEERLAKVASDRSRRVSERLEHLFSLLTEESKHGRRAAVLLELWLRLHRENTMLAEKLRLKARSLRAIVDRLVAELHDDSFAARERAGFAVSLFFSAVESSLLQSMFVEPRLLAAQISSLLEIAR